MATLEAHIKEKYKDSPKTMLILNSILNFDDQKVSSIYPKPIISFNLSPGIQRSVNDYLETLGDFRKSVYGSVTMMKSC